MKIAQLAICACAARRDAQVERSASDSLPRLAGTMSDSSPSNSRGVCRPTVCSALVASLHLVAAVCSVLALVTVWDTISVERHGLTVDIGEADFKGLSFKSGTESGDFKMSWADSDSKCQGTSSAYAAASLLAAQIPEASPLAATAFPSSAEWCEDVHTTAAWMVPGLVGLAASLCVDVLMAIAIGVWVVKTCRSSSAHSFARAPKLACCVTAAGLPIAVACGIGRALLLIGAWVNVAKTDGQLADLLTAFIQNENPDTSVKSAGVGPGALWLLGATLASLVTIPIALKARKARNDLGYVPQVDADGFGGSDTGDSRGVALVGGGRYEPPGGRV